MRSANQEHLSYKGTVIIRNNVLSESVSDYFKIVVTIPVLDHLTVEIGRIFDHGSISVYSGLVIISSKMVSLVSLEKC